MFHSSSVIRAASFTDSSRVSRMKAAMPSSHEARRSPLRTRLIRSENSTTGSMPMKR